MEAAASSSSTANAKVAGGSFAWTFFARFPSPEFEKRGTQITGILKRNVSLCSAALSPGSNQAKYQSTSGLLIKSSAYTKHPAEFAEAEKKKKHSIQSAKPNEEHYEHNSEQRLSLHKLQRNKFIISTSQFIQCIQPLINVK